MTNQVDLEGAYYKYTKTADDLYMTLTDSDFNDTLLILGVTKLNLN